MSRSNPVRQWMVAEHIEEAAELVEQVRAERAENPFRKPARHRALLAEAQVHVDLAALKFAQNTRPRGLR